MRYVYLFEIVYKLRVNGKNVGEPVPELEGKNEGQTEKVPEATKSDMERMRDALEPYEKPDAKRDSEKSNKEDAEKKSEKVPVLTRGKTKEAVLGGDEQEWDF